MKRVLITGGAGFIGSNLTKKLLASGGYHVTCIDNFDPSYPREQKENGIKDFFSDPNFAFLEGDIRRESDLNQIKNIDVIIHLAARAGVRQSIDNPGIYQDINVVGTLKALEYAKNNCVRKFIFASSSSVYGTNANFPWNEEENTFPISPYASSKISGETLGHVYSHLYNIKFLALRFFTVYGPSQRPDLAIHKFLDGISNNRPITAYGTGETFVQFPVIFVRYFSCASLNFTYKKRTPVIIAVVIATSMPYS
jgi:UDP-glucuronate 4-epimerase